MRKINNSEMANIQGGLKCIYIMAALPWVFLLGAGTPSSALGDYYSSVSDCMG